MSLSKEQLKVLSMDLAMSFPPSYCAQCEGELYPALERSAGERNGRVAHLREAIGKSGKDVHDPDGELFQRIARKIEAAQRLVIRMPFGGKGHRVIGEPAPKREFLTLLTEIEEIVLTAICERIGAKVTSDD